MFYEFEEKTSSTQQSRRVDRFVLARQSLEALRRRQYVITDCEPAPYIWSSDYIRQKKFLSHINSAYGLQSAAPAQPEQAWPCERPRTRAHLSVDGNVLRLPNYSDAVFPEVIDWSKDNIVVAALGTKYYKWSSQSRSVIGQGLTLFNAVCCKFEPTGERLALGTVNQCIEVHDALNKKVAGNWCPCVSLGKLSCVITALDWSPTGNTFVTGCSRGMVTSLDRDAALLHQQLVTMGAIFMVRVSPDARYVAAVAVNSSEVLMMYWPSLQKTYTICAGCSVTTFAWHPWSTALLGIGGMKEEAESLITLWHAPRGTRRASTTVSKRDYSLDTMLFSQRTGELVLNLWKTAEEEHANVSPQLVVMSAPDTVVDQWGGAGEGEALPGMARARTIILSPDGSKLAAGTAVDGLLIWNFLPEDKDELEETRRRGLQILHGPEPSELHDFSLR